jgi:GxxExxY protein
MTLQGPDTDLTGAIIGCAFRVHAELGSGFLEKVYENALMHELTKSGIQAEAQHPIQVFYDGISVGEYFADILVADRVIVELKACKALEESHTAQTLHYLKATKRHTALLLNFGTQSLDVKRLVR